MPDPVDWLQPAPTCSACRTAAAMRWSGDWGGCGLRGSAAAPTMKALAALPWALVPTRCGMPVALQQESMQWPSSPRQPRDFDVSECVDLLATGGCSNKLQRCKMVQPDAQQHAVTLPCTDARVFPASASDLLRCEDLLSTEERLLRDRVREAMVRCAQQTRHTLEAVAFGWAR